ncbi:MAG: hypothetical protein V4757_00060 [Pseudomonadota bacterium]
MSTPAEDATPPGPWARRIMTVAWPAFLSACLLELLVFSVVDPLDLHLVGWSRQAVYTASFFAFWLVSMVSNAVTALLCGHDGRPAP